jgi:hypothetical protein
MSKKISELTTASALAGTELVEIVQSGTNKKTTTQDIADLGGGGGITNSAAANEMMKSNGTNAVASGLGSTSLGNLDLGLSGTAGAARIIDAVGSSADISLAIRGKGTGVITIANSSGNALLQIDPGTGTGVGSIVHRVFSASTNTVEAALKISRGRDTGTPATGVGTGLQFEAETSVGNFEVGATIEAVTSDVTSTSEDFDLVFKNMTAGAAASEKLRITSDGSIGIGGTSFGSGSKVIFQANAITVPSTNPTGGVIPYAEGGIWKYRDGSGNIITI